MVELLYKPDFERAQKYWDAFWAHEIIDRPCTVIWAKKKPDADEPVIIQPVMADFKETFSYEKMD